MRNPTILFACLLWFCHTLCLAQGYPIQKYTDHQGLAQMQVYTVCRDSRGIVWAGTGFGLSRFNGETFTNYTTTDGLLGNFISNIQEDNKGYIWISCGTKGLVRFDGKTFKPYPFPKGTRNGANPVIDDKDEIFVFPDGKIHQVVGDTLLPIILKNMPSSIREAKLNAVFFIPTKSLIINTENQFYSYKSGNWQLLNFPENSRILVVFKDKIILKFFNKALEEVYSEYNGIDISSFMKIKDEKIEVIKPLNHDFVFSAGKNLYFLKKNTDKADFIAPNPPVTNDFSYLNQPDGATLWIPTEKGLWQLTRNGFRQFSEDQVPYCWGVVEDKNKQLYFLNYDVSLQKFDGKNLTTIPNSIFKFGSETIHKQIDWRSNAWYYKPLRDKYDNLWLPHVAGVLQYDYKKWGFYSPMQDNRLAFTIAEDTRRDKIVACGNDQLYTIQSKAPHSIEFIKDTTTIFDALILSVVVAPDKDYWFSGRGIGRYNPDTKTFKYYNIDPKSPFRRVLGLYFDWKGTLWAMSWDSGLYRFNDKKDIFERVLDEYFGDVITLMEQIDDEHLLLGNLQGIYVLNLKVFNQTGKIELKAYNQHNGFMGLEPGQLGTFRDSNGYVWITSSSVLTRMNPRELDLQKRPISTYITKIGTQFVPFVGKSEMIMLSNGQNTASFTVESIGEDKPFRSQYSFRIKGFLDKWSDWQEQNLLMVNNLPNGTHTIEVRSRTGTLETTESNIVSHKFYVAAPFYRSPNFYKYASFLGLFLLLGMLYLWQRERLQSKKLNDQRKHIEEQETKVRFLQVQTIQAQMNPHFTFNVLGTLQHLILNNDTQKANENLIKLSSLIRNYLEASLLGDEQVGSLFKHEIVLSREVELLEMYIEFEQLQYENRFDFEIVLDKKLNPNNYRVPPLIIQPFIENAIKHGLLYKNPEEKGHLRVHFLSLDEDTLICTIEDDGVGRAKAAELQQASFKKYKSRGTELVKRRVNILNEMGYDIVIKTDDGLKGGTVVTIKIGYK